MVAWSSQWSDGKMGVLGDLRWKVEDGCLVASGCLVFGIIARNQNEKKKFFYLRIWAGPKSGF
jgi:hypothetical protein